MSRPLQDSHSMTANKPVALQVCSGSVQLQSKLACRHADLLRQSSTGKPSWVMNLVHCLPNRSKTHLQDAE